MAIGILKIKNNTWTKTQIKNHKKRH